jgi:integrase
VGAQRRERGSHMGITKRADSLYLEFRVIDDGDILRLAAPHEGGKLKRWKCYTLNRKLAKDQESIVRTNLMKGIVKSERIAKVPMFREWAKRYLDLPEVKALRSYDKHVTTVMNRLVPFFGDRLLTDIRAHDVEAYRAGRTRGDGEAAAISTTNWDHAVLKAMLNKAIKRDLLTVNPAKKVSLPDPQNERDRILTADEWTRLYAEAADHLKPIMLVAYRVGMRYSEIVRLTWDRVDRERGLITLRAIDTKTKRPRQVPMTADVLATLKELHKVRYLGQDRVFLRDGKPITSVKTAMKNAKKRASITNFRFHDMRHCAATSLRRAGVDNTTAMAIIGHRSERMWRRYNTIDATDLRAAAAKVNTLITLTAEQSETSVANTAKS